VAVLNARRAGAFTGPTEKAEIQVFFEPFGEFYTAIGGGFDQMNPAAWRFSLQAKSTIGGALIQAQAAVDALVEFREI